MICDRRTCWFRGPILPLTGVIDWEYTYVAPAQFTYTAPGGFSSRVPRHGRQTSIGFYSGTPPSATLSQGIPVLRVRQNAKRKNSRVSTTIPSDGAVDGERALLRLSGRQEEFHV
ncbi:hypothetical protein BO94DRAFT_533117 [Aspergillus sclerotioniger CBS 115572]|uniref:Uncharacterized protein n=1 Tax=Aspergillus sclerotioniger CBS 115572 TaxID=1450535 RepID=A0A317X3X3_9EURO|nr:hypothetical protein BO94DRAFT_533117 [Aspergillus sclerotioniger CBS 115572]PWY91658.1 hypothetical protein BO94DRAFT_533117 [Aspergillus sclerotioniger CBS 115572]